MRKLAFVVSRFNEEVTAGLFQGAQKYLREKGIPEEKTEVFSVSGAFEIPLVAQQLARTGRYSGVICLGCVIKGDTAHFEFISLGATIGLMQSALHAEIPISFGILTTYTEEQAIVRSRDNSENKGREAAAACLDTLTLLDQIKNLGKN